MSVRPSEAASSTDRGSLRVKICGCRTPEDVAVAAEAGASYVGFVFAESPRRITSAAAAKIISTLPESLSAVGVFVDVGTESVCTTASSCGLQVAQLHGSESPEMCAELRADGLNVWKALPVRDPGDLSAALDLYGPHVDGLLVEGFSAQRAGGTGTAFPYEWLAGTSLASRPSPSPGPRWILAGGLTPENVAQAVRRARPDVVDVSSGVERRPGEKDPELIRLFVARALEAASEPTSLEAANELGRAQRGAGHGS